MKQLHLVMAHPSDLCFAWQTAVNLYNQRKYGLSNKARILVYSPHDRKKLPGIWKFLETKFPESKFFYYTGTKTLSDTIGVTSYIPLLRPYILQKHWEEFPELKNDAIFYHDSDIVFTKDPKFLNECKDDDINYLSDTKSYLNSDYFQAKRKDVLKEKEDRFRTVDPLQEVARFMGITREIFIENRANTGGAQYLLKNIDKNFWKDVFDNCIQIRTYLMDINKRFFANEDAGYQSWTADMWAVIGNLWKRKAQVVCPEIMNFSWSSEEIENWTIKGIYHDAGAGPEPFERNGKKLRAFYKKGNPIKLGENTFYDYILSPGHPDLKTPFDDNLSWVSPELCSSKYVEEILLTKQFLNQ